MPRFRLAVAFTLALLALALPALAFAGSPAWREPGTSEDWMGTYYQGKKLGFIQTLRRVSERGIELESRVYLQLKSEDGKLAITSFTQKTGLTPKLKLAGFTLLQEITGHRQKVEGREEAGQLVFRVTGEGFDQTRRLPYPPGSALSTTYLFNLLDAGLEVGREGTMQVFLEPYQMMAELSYRVDRREDLSYQGETVPAWVVEYRLGGMQSTLWVSEEGRVMRERSSQGFLSILEPEAAARDMGGDPLSMSSVITLSLVKPEREIAEPENRRRLKLAVANLEAANSIPEDHRQSIVSTGKAADGTFSATLEINMEPEAPAGRAAPVADLARWLGDSPTVQANHPRIRRLARELAGDAADPWQAARAINLWVYSNLKKDSVDATTALDALNDGRGECQSHTYLFTALARASGIPTKIVNGLVYSSQYGGFLYHAWPEVYVGEWRALDPTFGQDRVDATHLKLSEGSVENPLNLMSFIGKVKIEVLEP